MTRLDFVDVTLRDAHQCLWATRMPTAMMLPIAAPMDRAGFKVIDLMAAVTFDVCVRYLREDPWARIRLLRREAVDSGERREQVLETGARQHPLHRDVPEAVREPPIHLPLLLRGRGEVAMSTFAGHHDVTAARRNQNRGSQSGPGSEHGDRRAVRRPALLHRELVAFPQPRNRESERFEVVQDDELLEPEPLAQIGAREFPGKVGEGELLALRRTGDRHGEGGRTAGTGIRQEPFDRLGLTLRDGLHRPVVAIGDISRQAVPPSRIQREIAEAHALHSTAHDEPSSDAHQTIVSHRRFHLGR